MALLACALLKRRQDALTAPLCVLTVDHGLRSGSAQEAASVKRFCDEHGVEHATLTWTGQKPGSAVAERARLMRRDLMVEECKRRGVQQLLLAHTMDDVAETLLMRVRRGGVRGHAGIAPNTQIAGINILRPFLSLYRQDLRSALGRSKINWIDDPTNENMEYERPRVRRTLRQMDRGNFPTVKIAAYAALMGRWRIAMGQQIASVIEAGCRLTGCAVELQEDALRSIPPMIAIETVRELVRFVGGDSYMIDFSQAREAVRRIDQDESERKAFSAGRCVLSPKKNNIWVISRAQRDLPIVSIAVGQSITWDGRFKVQIGPSPEYSYGVTAMVRGAANGEPIVLPPPSSHSIAFRPRVLDGPRSSFDKSIFAALEALLTSEFS